MVQVTELGYIGLDISDAAAWKDYASACLALEVLDEGEADRFYLRMDNWHHRFVLHVGKGDDLAYLGWRVADAEALDEMYAVLTREGINVRRASPEEAKERFVLGLLKMTDPSGNPVEIFHSPRVDTHLPFHPGRRMHGRFVTGAEGMGHAVIKSDDPVASHRFYSLLGLKGTVGYHLQSPVGTLEPIFMHCNDRQHSIAFGIPGEKRLNHILLEYAQLDDLGMAHDIVRSRHIPVALQLGKHSNDQALSFYSATPSGWLMELGWGAMKAQAQQQYHLQDIFGHGVETAGIGLDVEL
jgi:2,3-dihydroxybiphenyl 1,2-dioxygenase